MKKYKITKEQLRKFDRKANREIELENVTGWKAVHKTHPSRKTYNRKNKPKDLE